MEDHRAGASLPAPVGTADRASASRAARRPAVGRFILDVVAIARPWLWPVSLLPYYVGVVLANERLLPTVGQLPQLLIGALVVEPLAAGVARVGQDLGDGA